jgi:phosphocarrier protein
MGVLLLAAPRGSEIMISADGADEGAALEALCQLVESGFGEEPCTA